MWKVITRCVPSKQVSQPVYTRDMKELADAFTIFYTSVGAKAAEESKKIIAILNNLPLMQPEELGYSNYRPPPPPSPPPPPLITLGRGRREIDTKATMF